MPGRRRETDEFPFPIVSEKAINVLDQNGPLAREDYRENKLRFLRWLRDEGKNPFRGEGYAPSTIRTTHYRIDQAYSWYWESVGTYSWDLGPTDATEMIDEFVKYSDMKDPYIVEVEKAIKRLFAFLNQTDDRDIEWDHDRDLSASYDSERDHFRPKELRALYDAALTYGTVKSPHTDSMSAKERDRLAGILAKRFEKPKEEITPKDFNRANSWKIPSMIGVTNDTGLRPKEVGDANTYWIDTDRGLLHIPSGEATKTDGEWTCGLSTRTCNALDRWLDERENYGKYDNSDALWLNKRGSRYNTHSLNYLLKNLMEEADIESGWRDLSWYSIRHAVATIWANQEGVHHAKKQLRHKKPETTLRYLHSTADERSENANSKW